MVPENDHDKGEKQLEELSVVAYGGGTNSTAMLIGMVLKGFPPPHLISMGDTGCERPETYGFVNLMSDWLQRQGWPRITMVVKTDKDGNQIKIDDYCLSRKALPSIAYGRKSCSDHFKIRPQSKLYRNDPEIKKLWKAGGKVVRYIGFDADEEYRTYDTQNDSKYENRYPLIEWGWGREECLEQIRMCQLPNPGKSSCFFCPHNKAWEIRQLQYYHPDLLERALEIESNAELTAVKGLGRTFSWQDFINQGVMFSDAYEKAHDELPCGCYDG